MAKPAAGVPTAAEFGLLRAFLATHGVHPADMNTAIGGASPAGRTRATIAAALKGWLKTRPKKP